MEAGNGRKLNWGGSKGMSLQVAERRVGARAMPNPECPVDLHFVKALPHKYAPVHENAPVHKNAPNPPLRSESIPPNSVFSSRNFRCWRVSL